MRVILGLDRPGSGTATVNGKPDRDRVQIVIYAYDHGLVVPTL